MIHSSKRLHPLAVQLNDMSSFAVALNSLAIRFLASSASFLRPGEVRHGDNIEGVAGDARLAMAYTYCRST